jgi:hypothetical protein
VDELFFFSSHPLFFVGEIICSDLEYGVPEEHRRHAEEAAEALGDGIWTCMPFVHGARPREVGGGVIYHLILDEKKDESICESDIAM